MLCVAVFLCTSQALAAWSLSDITARLRDASDDRVRVQAALALGASMSVEAVVPLCGGLRDPSATVRGAAAAGLGRLKRSQALPCLESREESENNALVRAEIRRSIHRIKSVVPSNRG
jgi:HEAT repeat protein